jgi:hypothetical protein
MCDFIGGQKKQGAALPEAFVKMAFCYVWDERCNFHRRYILTDRGDVCLRVNPRFFL